MISSSLVVGLFLAEAAARTWLAWQSDRLKNKLESSETSDVKQVDAGSNLMGLIRPSPIAGLYYQLKTHLNAVFAGVPVMTDEFGFRGSGTFPRKAERQRRIAGLGDSVMFGLGVSHEETFIKRVEYELNRRGSGYSYEAVNTGVPGYNTSQEVILFDSYRRILEPDLIVIAYTGNDMLPPQFRPDLNADGTFNEFNLALWVLLDRGVDNMLFSLRWNPESDDRLYGAIPMSLSPVEEALSSLAATAKSIGVPVVLVHGKYGFKKDFDRSELWVSQREAIRKAAQDNGMVFVDQVEIYLHEMRVKGYETSEPFWVAPQDRHPNAAGHRLMAEGVLGKLPGDW
ncbi:MAG: SGNH/GDSL hydrolase family protein [Verrucomicrobia bacterium]|nr:SGNH/GDSL hydrolase family protein [Verrucomicrobiota bacterium]